MRVLTLLMACLAWLQAAKIDPNLLEQMILEHPGAVRERLILARYYTDHDAFKKAAALLEEAKKMGADPQQVQALQKHLETRRKVHKILTEAGLSFPIERAAAQKRLEYEAKEGHFQRFSDLYQALVTADVPLADTLHREAARLYLQEGHYRQAREALRRLKDPQSRSARLLKARLCLKELKYACAEPLLRKLYDEEPDPKIALDLIRLDLATGRLDDARGLFASLRRREDVDTKTLETVGKEIRKKQARRIETLEKAYRTKPDFSHLEPLVHALVTAGKRSEALQKLARFNTKHPTPRSLYLEASLLAEEGAFDKAAKVLEHPLTARTYRGRLLIGRYLSWGGRSQEAIEALKQAVAQAKNPDERYEAQKALAFVYLWNHQPKRARTLLRRLLKEHPEDREVREAALAADGAWKKLAAVYEKALRSNPQARDYLRLAQLYQSHKEPQRAEDLYREGLKKFPDDYDLLRAYGLFLIEKGDDRKGFGYLEYATILRDTAAAYRELAALYHRYGFDREALSVLNEWLAAHPEDRSALKLKADILKLSPRLVEDEGSDIRRYYDKLGGRLLDKADRLYLSGHNLEAAAYYEHYLMQHPDDDRVRRRFAHALEYSGQYGRAAGEFSLLLENTKTDDRLRYHYGYALIKSGKIDKGRAVLTSLLGKYPPPLPRRIERFLKAWKEAWESGDFDRYESYYAPALRQNDRWRRTRKARLRRAGRIEVQILNPTARSVGQGVYDVTFYQIYRARHHRDGGYKTLRIRCKEKEGPCVIEKESWRAAPRPPKEPPSLAPLIRKALEEAERLSRLQPLPGKKKNIKRYRDIYLPGLKKNVQRSDEVLTTVTAQPVGLGQLSSEVAANLPAIEIAAPSDRPSNRVRADYYLYRDNYKIRYTLTRLEASRRLPEAAWELGASTGRFSLENSQREKVSGRRYAVTLRKEGWYLKAGLDDFSDHKEGAAEIAYARAVGPHYLTFRYSHQNALFRMMTLCPARQRITDDRIEVSGYRAWAGHRDLWWSVALDRYSNLDLQTTPQFDWRFYYYRPEGSAWDWHLVLNGWYAYHSRPNRCFYSPQKDDSTLLRLETRYRIGGGLTLSARGGSGYSFASGSRIYRYGANLAGRLSSSIDFKVDCLRSNASQLGTGSQYRYDECRFFLEGRW